MVWPRAAPYPSTLLVPGVRGATYAPHITVRPGARRPLSTTRITGHLKPPAVWHTDRCHRCCHRRHSIYSYCTCPPVPIAICRPYILHLARVAESLGRPRRIFLSHQRRLHTSLCTALLASWPQSTHNSAKHSACPLLYSDSSTAHMPMICLPVICPG